MASVFDLGDDSIVPSTPTLQLPHRSSDGFAEAVWSVLGLVIVIYVLMLFLKYSRYLRCRSVDLTFTISYFKRFFVNSCSSVLNSTACVLL